VTLIASICSDMTIVTNVSDNSSKLVSSASDLNIMCHIKTKFCFLLLSVDFFGQFSDLELKDKILG